MGFVVQATAFAEQITADLRMRIATFELEPGTHLVEGRLAVEYDVSRAPIREALKQLKTEGLVEARKRGVFVTGLNAVDIEEITEVRGAIESLAARLAKAKATEDDWRAMERAIDRMRRAAGAFDAREFATADMEFHTAIYTASGNRRLLDVWMTYASTFITVLRLSKKTPDDLIEGTRSHERLLDVLRADDTDAAVAAVLEHLQGTRRLLLEAVQRAEGERKEILGGTE